METRGIIFSFGGIYLTLYGLCIASGILLGYMFSKQSARRCNIRISSLQNAYIGLMAGALIGARLIYVIINHSFYAERPLAVLHIWEGGYSIFGAIVGCILGLRIATKKRGFRAALDMLMPALLLTLAVWRLGELSTWQGRGMLTGEGAPAFPITVRNSQGFKCMAICVYEASAAIAIMLYALNSNRRQPAGDIGFMCIMLLGLSQIPLESMRSDEFLQLSFIKIDQAIGMIMAFSVISIFMAGSMRTCQNRAAALSAYLISIIMIAMCIAEEFKIDGSSRPALHYAMLCLYVTIMALCGQYLRRSWRALQTRKRAVYVLGRRAPEWSNARRAGTEGIIMRILRRPRRKHMLLPARTPPKMTRPNVTGLPRNTKRIKTAYRQLHS